LGSSEFDELTSFTGVVGGDNSSAGNSTDSSAGNSTDSNAGNSSVVIPSFKTTPHLLAHAANDSSSYFPSYQRTELKRCMYAKLNKLKLVLIYCPAYLAGTIVLKRCMYPKLSSANLSVK
jgi:hypothetical protein